MHAVERFKTRTGAKYSSSKVRERLTQLYEQAERVELKPKFIVTTILQHNFEEAEYYSAGGFIMVIVNGEMKTVHKGEAHKWQKMKK